jgi:acetoin utilization deacetylase AcuC-like enzyme
MVAVAHRDRIPVYIAAMHTLYSDRHRLHHGQAELIDGHFMPCFEKPERADLVLARVNQVGLGPVLPPQAHGLGPVKRVHRADFVDFLASAWARWTALGRSHDALPLIWPVPALCGDRSTIVRPEHVDGQLGYYALDAGVPITAGTWAAVQDAADVALTGVDLLNNGQPAAFALCRPPGHHAAAAAMGGYCYLNNAAIAVQALRDQGVARVAVLDVDYHHGNGTQSIFYDRADVFFASLHADPLNEYPYFLGYADECGRGAGLGCNLNLPLPHGTAWAAYAQALDAACQAIESFKPDVLVVSLGVDTFELDPISKFRLTSDDYLRMGQRIAALKRPTLFVFEGGYAVEAVGVNAVNVLQGFEGG